jgi:hypothetical protein
MAIRPIPIPVGGGRQLSVPLGGGTYLDIGFGGLGDLLTPDLLALIKYLQGEIEKTPGSETNKPIRDALSRWNKLLNDYKNGDATLQDLKDFDPGVLGDMGVWSDYYDDFISGEEDRSGDVDYGGATGEVVDTTTQGPEGDWNEDFGVEVDVRPPRFPTTESKRTDGGAGGGLMTGGGIDTGTIGGPGPATESKRTDGGTGDAGGEDTGDDGGEDTGDAGTGDGRLDVLGEDWEYDPEHDYIYVGDCTFIRVDKNGNPIGEPLVAEGCAFNDDIYVVGGNYSGPDSEPEPTEEVIVDVFGEGSIIDTTKDNTEPEEKDKEDTEPEEKEKEDTTTTPTTPTVTTTTTTTQPPTGPTTESKRTDGGGDVGGDIETSTGTTPSTGPTTESKRTDGTGDGGDGTGDGGDGDGGDGTGGGEGVITFENMYGYYGNKDGGDGGGGGATESKGNGDGDGGGGNGDGGDGDGDGGDGDGDGGGEEGSMFKDISLGGTSGSAFTPFQAVPGYTAPTFAPINLPQQDYMAAINNLIARNSSMFKGYI